jgi:hypothetical protein
MRCGITLTAAYARMKQFGQALEVASKYLDWAKTMNKSSYLQRLQLMVDASQNGEPHSQ